MRYLSGRTLIDHTFVRTVLPRNSVLCDTGDRSRINIRTNLLTEVGDRRKHTCRGLRDLLVRHFANGFYQGIRGDSDRDKLARDISEV